MMLPAAPAAILGADGQPRFGRYAGLAAGFDWRRLAAPHARGRWWRRFHHKRWHYAALATPELFCGVAIVDVGWTSTAFAYAFDRERRQIVAECARDGLPGLSASLAEQAGGLSRFRFPGLHMELGAHGSGGYRLALRAGRFEIDARFGHGLGHDLGREAPLLLALGPVSGGAVHATQKSGGLALQGEARVAGASYRLDGGVASFDYSNGLLARETAWRWASAHSLDLGFNLQAGYFGASENALWLDGQLYGLGAAQFDFVRGDPCAPWHISTDDGLLDLHFRPEGARGQDKNLLIAASRYLQPIGTFSGWVRASRDAPKRIVAQLAGVTEDHWSRW